jgi:DNA-binding CsgD family transcriptional regulator
MSLTPRQMEVARLVAEGLSNKAIAKAVRLSVHTVDHHISEAAARIPGEGPPRLRVMLFILRGSAA